LYFNKFFYPSSINQVTKIKMIDVALEAGVSKSTVSQFLSGRFEYMSKSTRARIEKAVDDLNYVPNNIARSLKTKKTKTIGVIVRDVAGSYTSQSVRGMDDYCKKQGYNMIIYNTDFDSDAEARAIKSLKLLNVDGLIISSSGANNELIKEVSGQDVPVVQFQIEHEESAKSIAISDVQKAAYEATEYLINLGHKRICFVTQEYKTVKSRLAGFLGYSEALAKHDIAVDEQLIQYWHRGQGLDHSSREMMAIDNPPTAFFAQHLAISIDLLKDLDEAGIRIPEDVSFISFDDLPLAEFFKVPITVIKQESYEIGKQAAKEAINQIQNPGAEVQRVIIPCSLIERASCRAIED